MSGAPEIEPGESTAILDRHRIIRNFDAAAGGYDEVAVLQRCVAERLDGRLDYMRANPERVLDLGSGTGYGAGLLARRYPRAEVAQLDFSRNMLLEARRQAAPELARRAAWVQADAHALPFRGQSLDLVYSSFMLQWCAVPQRVFRECRRVLRPGGLLLFSTCGPDTLRELRRSWSLVDDYPHVHPFPDMHDVGDDLVRAGFQAPVMEVEYFTLTYADCAGLLRDLRRLGAGNAYRVRAPGLAGARDALRRLREAYEALRMKEGLPATYEVIYGHAWTAPRPGPGPAPVFWKRPGDAEDKDDRVRSSRPGRRLATAGHSWGTIGLKKLK